MRHAFIALVLLCAGASCNKAKKPKELDWHRTPLKLMTASSGGIQFEMSIPEDWVPRTPPDEGWGPPTGDAVKRPFVTIQNVSSDMASSMESAISSAGAKPENIIRKDKRGENYVITEAQEPTMIRATTFKRVGGTFLWCTASQANDDGIPVFTETRQVLQKICDSVTPK
jgi:hypothetical protein